MLIARITGTLHTVLNSNHDLRASTEAPKELVSFPEHPEHCSPKTWEVGGNCFQVQPMKFGDFPNEDAAMERTLPGGSHISRLSVANSYCLIVAQTRESCIVYSCCSLESLLWLMFFAVVCQSRGFPKIGDTWMGLTGRTKKAGHVRYLGIQPC